MLDSNIILGIRGNLGCEDYSHGILTQEWEGWPCGTPVVYPDAALANSGGSMQVMSLTSVSQNSAGRETSSVPTAYVVPVDLRPLCNNHKVINVSRFDISKFDRLLEYVRDVGGLSLVIEDSVGRKDVTNKIKKIDSRFKYTSLFYYNGWGTKNLNNPDDRYVCILTFLDLPYCIPMFNMRKADGVGLSFCGATVEASKSYGQLHRIFRVDTVYSNFLDNVFVIDGVDVNTPGHLDKESWVAMTEMAGQDLPVAKTPKKYKVSSKKKEPSGYEMYKLNGKKDRFGAEEIEWKTAPASNQVVFSNASLTIPDNGSEVMPSDGVLEMPEETEQEQPSLNESEQGIAFNSGGGEYVVSNEVKQVFQTTSTGHTYGTSNNSNDE